MVPLALNKLLLGGNSTEKPNYTSKGKLTNISGSREYHRQLLTSWWSMWKEQSFPHLLPFYIKVKAEKNDNLEVGDICLLKFKN